MAAKVESTPTLPGLSPVCGKPIIARFDGGKLSSDGGVLVMATLFGMFPFLHKLYADGGYQGPAFQAALKGVLRGVDVEIVKRSDQAKGFVVLPKRGSSNAPSPGSTAAAGSPRIGENLSRNALAFLRLASIRLMVRKLCNTKG
jgi:hypothetical protein